MQTIFPDPTVAGFRITDYRALKDSWQNGSDWFAWLLGKQRFLSRFYPIIYSLKMANLTQKSEERIPEELQQSSCKCITV